jgi:hypothetical protein
LRKKRGYNIGLRLIDEFLARSGIGRCADLKDTAEVIAKACEIKTLFAEIRQTTSSSCVGWIQNVPGSYRTSRWVSAQVVRAGALMHLIGRFDADKKEFSLVLEENPLTDFAELPEQYRGLNYCNVLCGVIRGALAMV